MTAPKLLAGLLLGTSLAGCTEEIQTPTDPPFEPGSISAAPGNKVDTHSRAYLIFADSVLVDGAWVPTGIRGDGRLKDGAAAGPGMPSNEYQGDFCGVRAVIGSLARENGDMVVEVGADSSCGAPRSVAIYGGGLTSPPTMVETKTTVRGLYSLAVGQSTTLWEGFGRLPGNFGCGLMYFDDQYPPANSPRQTRLTDSTRSDGVVVRRWRVESRGSHQAACVTLTKNGSVQSVGPLYYLPFAMTVVEIPYPYPTWP
ncbi:MAG TPA: hypothetical protein VJQ79_14705 [Acidimicrobiia bacterium]|nr:hypothetical protein [Acidimicrobiia bacterium]